jgi:glyoxylase-like metal-dependent hydrolase (beta-lactamase superfamily II)
LRSFLLEPLITPRVITLPVGQLQSNCYLYKINETQAVVIDPGDDADFINQKLIDYSLEPVAVLLTHGHFDHVLGGFAVQLAFGCPVYIHQDDDFLLERMRDTTIHFTQTDPGPAPVITHFFSNEKEIEIGDTKITILKTPGHTPGSLCFFDKKHHVLFSGDLIFADGSRGGADHSYSDRQELLSSIKAISKLPKNVTIYPGHGESFTVNELVSGVN